MKPRSLAYRHDQFVAELHKRYVGSKAGQPIPIPPSLTDLRGFVGPGGLQQVGSLQSDFLGVAEHLHERHPSLADRYVFQDADPCTHIPEASRTAPKQMPLDLVRLA